MLRFGAVVQAPRFRWNLDLPLPGVDKVTLFTATAWASGLRPSRELPDAEPLRFHIAIGYMSDPARLASTPSQACLARMMQAVKDMSDGSRKAIRLIHL